MVLPPKGYLGCMLNGGRFDLWQGHLYREWASWGNPPLNKPLWLSLIWRSSLLLWELGLERGEIWLFLWAFCHLYILIRLGVACSRISWSNRKIKFVFNLVLPSVFPFLWFSGGFSCDFRFASFTPSFHEILFGSVRPRVYLHFKFCFDLWRFEEVI